MIRLTDLASLVAPATLPTRDVLGRIDACAYLFQVIVDEKGALLGTVTDGDIRRAMLRGVDLAAPILDCANREPLIGAVDDQAGNVALLKHVRREPAFLPVVDAAGVLREIWVADDQPALPARALVMAGGYGTRLGERTRRTPKPLLEVGGRPILEHVLSGLEQAGIGEIYVAAHYLADQVVTFVEDREGAARLTVIREERPLGTAGALAQLPAQRDPVLVVNGDLITRIDYRALCEFHGRHGYDGSIAVAPYQLEIPFGVVRHDGDGLFAGIDEKPVSQQFVAAGVYCLAPEFQALVPRGTAIDMPALLNRGREIGLKVGLFPIHESWLDVGRPADLETADSLHRAALAREA